MSVPPHWRIAALAGIVALVRRSPRGRCRPVHQAAVHRNRPFARRARSFRGPTSDGRAVEGRTDHGALLGRTGQTPRGRAARRTTSSRPPDRQRRRRSSAACSLDLTGRMPTPREIYEFVRDRDPAKRAKLIDKLLASDAYARHWAKYWRDVIAAKYTDRRQQALLPEFEKWLTDEFRENKSWRDMTRAMLTAEGGVADRPGMPADSHEAQSLSRTGPPSSCSPISATTRPRNGRRKRRGSSSASRFSAPSATTTRSTNGSSGSSTNWPAISPAPARGSMSANRPTASRESSCCRCRSANTSCRTRTTRPRAHRSRRSS